MSIVGKCTEAVCMRPSAGIILKKKKEKMSWRYLKPSKQEESSSLWTILTGLEARYDY